MIFEAQSKGTRCLDDGEKKDAYLTIPSRRIYVMVEQETAAIMAYRRTDQGFVREMHEGLEAILPLPEIGVALPLREAYEAVEFTPEADPED